MFTTRSHVRATLLPRATRCLAASQAKRTIAIATSIKPELLQVQPGDEVAEFLRESGVWSASRSIKKRKIADRHRVNLVSEKLVDDTLNYLKPTLGRHEGCDLLDVFPGAGVWSRKLNDLLKPRTHLLLEPDEEFYKPLLEPFLERPGVQLLPESGIVWEHLNRILRPEFLPHQVEKRFTVDKPPKRNDTLLVTMNLSMYPKRKFRVFDSLAQLVMFQLISSMRPGALFQKYGNVRMLIWVQDNEKFSIVPRTAQRRRKMAIEAELSTDWVCEIAGADEIDDNNPRTFGWFRRDQSIDAESTGKALKRMKKLGMETPPGRESQYMREYLAFTGTRDVAGTKAAAVERPFLTELAKLESKFEQGVFAEDSADHKRLKTLSYWLRWSAKRSSNILDLLKERDKAVKAFIKASTETSTDKERARAKKLNDAWNEKVSHLEKSLRSEGLLHRDNLHLLHQKPPVLNWDRRYADPLIVQPQEFFPNVPCALLDLQPKAAARVLRDMGPDSTRSGDMFDLVLRGIAQNPVDTVSKALETLYPGAANGIIPECPSLTDPKQGGSPLTGWGELTTRSLSEKQLVEIIEAWMKWPFRPSYSELVSRTMDDGTEDDNDGDTSMMGNTQPDA